MWRTNARVGRTYGLIDLPDAQAAASIGAAVPRARVYDAPIIALALYPSVAQALPPLAQALGGPGKPAGMLACDPIDGGLVLEWDPERSSAAVVLGVVDVELERFRSGKTAELLAPLAPAWVARIAAEGLRAPDIAPERILETLIARAGLHAQ